MEANPGAGPLAVRDPLARVLEAGLALVILLAPIPSGSVREPARSALEIAALVLGLLWLARALARETALPPRPVRAGLFGLLALALLQALPLGAGIVGAISPRAAAVREDAVPPGDAAAAESRLLGRDPRTLDAVATLSVDPASTASALRTGAALAMLLLIACAVSAARGPRGLALALLVSAAAQGLYGTLSAAASGGSALASGTYVNKNHFAGFLAMAIPPGLALVLSLWRLRGSRRGGLARFLGGDGSKALLLGLLALIALAGLLLSSSRAGIALGALGVVLTFAAAGRRGPRARVALALVVIAVAAVPLFQLGAERLAASYYRLPLEFTAAGSRGMVWGDTLSMVAAFPLSGSGFGTFVTAYPLFRSPGVRHLFVHAHNDPLEVLAEGGVAGLALLLLVAVPVGRRLATALSGAGGTVAAGLAAGTLAAMLHALVDFNFHVPSNAATAAILAGALLGLPWQRGD